MGNGKYFRESCRRSFPGDLQKIRMNILHVSAGIQETCGVSRFLMETARAQMGLGHRVCVVTTMTCGYPVGEVDVRLMDDPTSVDFQPDIVHIHGVWSRYLHRMTVWCRKRRIPYIISPHGALTKWALRYHWWKKLPAMLLYQYCDLRCASGFHVTVQEELKDVRRLWLKQPVIVAPLGVEIPEMKFASHENKDLLFVSRIHPKKGLDTLLHAWAKLSKDVRNGWRIIIAGPDDIGHQAELKELAEQLGLSVRDFSKELEFGKKQIHGGNEVPLKVYQEKLSEIKADVVFTGPVYSETKDWLYQQSHHFVLPSHSENFGGVILEALAAGTPCITTKGTPWASLLEHNCGWWVEDDVEAIRAIIAKVLALPKEQYMAMSDNARAFVREKFSWESSAQTLVNGYEKALREN